MALRLRVCLPFDHQSRAALSGPASPQAFKCTPCRAKGELLTLSLLGLFVQFVFVTITVWSNMVTNVERYASQESQPSDYIKARQSLSASAAIGRPALKLRCALRSLRW